MKSDTVDATSRVEVVPEGRASRPGARGLPAEFRVRVSDDPRSGPPLRLRAAGRLGESSDTRVDILFQGASQTSSIFGEHDTYRLSLDSPHYTVRLGDQVFGLSSLTDTWREGLGAEASVRAAGLEVGGYAQRSRRGPRLDTHTAAYGRMHLGASLDVGANWLRSRGPQGNREVWSGQGTLQVPGWLTLSGEYGSRPEVTARARSLELRAARGIVNLGLRHVRAASAFGGPLG